MTTWPQLATLDAFNALSDAERLALAKQLAAAVGDCTPMPTLVGAARMSAVQHTPTGLVLVAIPGGQFTMGLRDDERAELKRVVFGDAPQTRFETQPQVYQLPQSTPARTVTVAPFLCATGFVDFDGRALAEDGGEDPWLEDEDASSIREGLAARGLRLLSEAEWEWVAREGGTRSWIVNIEGKQGMDLDDGDEPATAWGIGRLKSNQGELVADGWHDSYEGAPTDSRAWDPQDVPGVHRGSSGCWQDDAEAIGCHAAFRAPGPGGAIRPARDLP